VVGSSRARAINLAEGPENALTRLYVSANAPAEAGLGLVTGSA